MIKRPPFQLTTPQNVPAPPKRQPPEKTGLAARYPKLDDYEIMILESLASQALRNEGDYYFAWKELDQVEFTPMQKAEFLSELNCLPEPAKKAMSA